MHLIETHKWLLGAEPPTSTEDTHAPSEKSFAEGVDVVGISPQQNRRNFFFFQLMASSDCDIILFQLARCF